MVDEIKAGKRTRKELEPLIAGWSVSWIREERVPTFGGKKYVRASYTFIVGWYGSIFPERMTIDYLEEGADFIVVGLRFTGRPFQWTDYVVSPEGIRKT